MINRQGKAVVRAEVEVVCRRRGRSSDEKDEVEMSQCLRSEVRGESQEVQCRPGSEDVERACYNYSFPGLWGGEGEPPLEVDICCRSVGTTVLASTNCEVGACSSPWTEWGRWTDVRGEPRFWRTRYCRVGQKCAQVEWDLRQHGMARAQKLCGYSMTAAKIKHCLE